MFWFGLLLLDFAALAVMCDSHLVPAIEVICERFSIPDAVAGASLLAFGSSAPEVMINAAAVAQPEPKIEMSLPALFGSAMIAFGLIPAACSYCVRGELELDPWPIARDTTCYALSLVLLIWILNKGHVTAQDASFLVTAFVLYMLLLGLPLLFKKGDGQAAEPSSPQRKLGIPEPGAVNKAPVQQSHSGFHRMVSAKDMTRRMRSSVVVKEGITVGRRRGSSIVGGQGKTQLSAYGTFAARQASGASAGTPRHGMDLGTKVEESGESPCASHKGDDEEEEEVSCVGKVCAILMNPIEWVCAQLMMKCLVTVDPASNFVPIPDAGRSLKAGIDGLQETLGVMVDRESLEIELVEEGGLAAEKGIQEGWKIAAIIQSLEQEGDADDGVDDEDKFKDLEEVAKAWDDARAGNLVDIQKPPSNCAVATVFLLSIFYVSLLSSLALSIAQEFTQAVCMPSTIAGATLLALGAQVPDTVGSIAMARAGLADGAVSNAIGSQLINVSLGAGLPFLLYDLLKGASIRVAVSDLHSLLAMGGYLGVLIVLYLCACLWQYITCRPAVREVELLVLEYREIKFESPAPSSADGSRKLARISALPPSMQQQKDLRVGISVAAIAPPRKAFCPVDGEKPMKSVDRLQPQDIVRVQVQRKGGLQFCVSGALLLVTFLTAYVAFVIVDVESHRDSAHESACRYWD